MPFKLFAFHFLEHFDVSFTVVIDTSELANPILIIRNASRKKKKQPRILLVSEKKSVLTLCIMRSLKTQMTPVTT